MGLVVSKKVDSGCAIYTHSISIYGLLTGLLSVSPKDLKRAKETKKKSHTSKRGKVVAVNHFALVCL